MKKNKKIISLLCMSFLIGLCSCGSNMDTNKNMPVEGLGELGDITVVSREEGSGTRSSFASLIGFEVGNNDLTTAGAVIVNDSAEVISAVKKDSDAIG